jgi:hypothetical protein
MQTAKADRIIDVLGIPAKPFTIDAGEAETGSAARVAARFNTPSRQGTPESLAT